jgi:hypothetical protein
MGHKPKLVMICGLVIFGTAGICIGSYAWVIKISEDRRNTFWSEEFQRRQRQEEEAQKQKAETAKQNAKAWEAARLSKAQLGQLQIFDCEISSMSGYRLNGRISNPLSMNVGRITGKVSVFNADHTLLEVCRIKIDHHFNPGEPKGFTCELSFDAPLPTQRTVETEITEAFFVASE